MDKNILSKPLRICQLKRGYNKLCPYADEKKGNLYCMLFEEFPTSEFRDCTQKKRVAVKKRT